MAATFDENNPRLSVDAAQLLADLPPRVARMETHIEYMRLDIAELKGGMKELRTELKSEVGELRTELKSEMGGLRTELKSEVAELRTEFKSEMGGLRTEFKSEVASLRTQMETKFLWFIGIMIAHFGGILAVMAHGFRWIG